jgi:DeoR/GlpR family transcriptional regulator of sugar metabolism
MAVCQLSRVATLITDSAAPTAALNAVRAAGVEVIVVDVELNSVSVAA